jgi:acyl-CoA dehydrogenase
LQAFRLNTEAELVRSKIRAAQKRGDLAKGKIESLAQSACEQGVITQAEQDLLHAATEACLEAIEVDVFTAEEYYGSSDIPGVTATGGVNSAAEAKPAVQAVS